MQQKSGTAKSAKRENKDLHVVWLDLENAYGSVPHQLISFALDFFHVPVLVKNIMKSYLCRLEDLPHTTELHN